MILLHNIGVRINSNYNTLEEISKCNEPLSFDGVYKNVYENRYSLLDYKNKTNNKIILFIIGDWVGNLNSADANATKLENMCNWNELMYLRGLGFEFGWHTWNHHSLIGLDDKELKKQLTPPFPMDYFAYPFGDYDKRVIEAVKNAGFKEAYSVSQGDGGQFSKVRKYLNW